jgi:hypothetical protein
MWVPGLNKSTQLGPQKYGTKALNSTSLNAITDVQFIVTHRAVTLARTAKEQRIGNGTAGLGEFLFSIASG